MRMGRAPAAPGVTTLVQADRRSNRRPPVCPPSAASVAAIAGVRAGRHRMGGKFMPPPIEPVARDLSARAWAAGPIRAGAVPAAAGGVFCPGRNGPSQGLLGTENQTNGQVGVTTARATPAAATPSGRQVHLGG